MTRYSDGVSEGAALVWWGFIVLAVVSVLFVLASLFGFGVQWATKPVEVMSADNVERQVAVVASRRRDLEASAANITLLQKAVKDFETANPNRANWNVGQRDQHANAVKAVADAQLAYNRQCADYRAFWDSQFRAVPQEFAQEVGLATRAPRDCPLITEP